MRINNPNPWHEFFMEARLGEHHKQDIVYMKLTAKGIVFLNDSIKNK